MNEITKRRNQDLEDPWASRTHLTREAQLAIQLGTLHVAKAPKEMEIAGWDLHALKGDLANHWSVKVNANWRLTFTFEGEDAILVDYRDYH